MNSSLLDSEEKTRVRLLVSGTVQGVGFRPFACRLARRLGLSGWVANTTEGLLVEVEGTKETVEVFAEHLIAEAPDLSRIERVARQRVPVTGERGFQIRTSLMGGLRYPAVPPDLAICADCLRELMDPRDRRFRYPFLTCTRCGPRFSILTDLPYDRARTTLSRFPLCASCLREYRDPADRRFHAEALACPSCGPRVVLWDGCGRVVAEGEGALAQACEMVAGGLVLAVKGLGGFQLWVDARSETAVRRLRDRKRRPHKPFAVLFPSLEAVEEACVVSPEESALLTSPQAPVVLLRRRPACGLTAAVAPGNALVGAMLPHSPLHVLLATGLGAPAVATSGNRSDEPIAIEEHDALTRLKDIADAYLVHDRAITRPVDDSVVRMMKAGPVILRRARGYVPSSILLPEELRRRRAPVSILAVGGQIKNTVALAAGDQVTVSQHLGDLSTPEAFAAFRRAIDDLIRLWDVKPVAIACDLHPDYRSTQYAQELAERLAVPVIPVQHHHAHIAACMAEHRLGGEVLGIAWDGSGYGPDGTVWGGEWLVVGYQSCRRYARWRPFRLPGGEAAVREPRRSALAVLWDVFREEAVNLVQGFKRTEQVQAVASLLRRQALSPVTSSLGRFFDAVASMLGFCQVASFEGQAAMAVEHAALEAWEKGADETGYPVAIGEDSAYPEVQEIDWRPMIQAIQDDLKAGIAPAVIAVRVHLALADAIDQVARAVGLPRVVLSGGCFQNGLLVELVRERLTKAGCEVFTHREVPPNDGGLSLGQAAVACAQARDASCVEG